VSARKGQQDGWPGTPCYGDTFHAVKPFGDLIFYVNNRALDSIKAVEELTHKMNKPRGKWKSENSQLDLGARSSCSPKRRARVLVDDLAILYRGLKNDILSLVGPSYEERQELLQFVIEQLHLREESHKHRIEPVRRYLENHSDNLLAFVPEMQKRFQGIAEELHLPLADVLAIYPLKRHAIIKSETLGRTCITAESFEK